MVEHVMSTLFDKLLTDPRSDKISLIDVIQRLTLHVASPETIEGMISESHEKGDKGILISSDFLLISWWIRSDLAKPEQATFRYVVENPSGARVHEESFGVDLSVFNGQRVIVKIRDFPVSVLGQHWILIETEDVKGASKQKKWKQVARLPLELVESSESPP